MEWMMLWVPVWETPPVLNLSHLLHLMQTARNTGGKRAQASQSRMAYLQAMKVQHIHFSTGLTFETLEYCINNLTGFLVYVHTCKKKKTQIGYSELFHVCYYILSQLRRFCFKNGRDLNLDLFKH